MELDDDGDETTWQIEAALDHVALSVCARSQALGEPEAFVARA